MTEDDDLGRIWRKNGGTKENHQKSLRITDL
jgi:hypothetical protein